MLKRERVLLEVVRRARRSSTRLQLVKWLFLLRQETRIAARMAFYDFLPYQYGPFSFTLYREFGELVAQGLLAEDGNEVRAVDDPSLARETSALTTADRADIATILRKYGKTEPDTLLALVYDRYPWFASRSRLALVPTSNGAQVHAYTIGYEGRSVDAFFNFLLRKGIKRVIDVRKNAFSRKYGFSESVLRSVGGKNGIEYVHVPELGIPSALRRDLKGPEDYEALFARYDAQLLPREAGAIARVSELQREKPSALLCFEADPELCHRTRVARAVSASSGLRVVHL